MTEYHIFSGFVPEQSEPPGEDQKTSDGFFGYFRVGNIKCIFKYSNAHAYVTSGGVSTKEIDPKTMESRLVKGLYFAGEVIDVDAYTGGYNLQIAFSCAYAAAKAATHQ